MKSAIACVAASCTHVRWNISLGL